MTITIVVEDGTGVSGANSYVSEANALTYHESHGNTSWASATETARKIALIRGTQYIDFFRLKGSKTNAENALEFPRYGVEDQNGYLYSSDEIPAKLKAACCEVALIELSPGTIMAKSTSGVIRKKFDIIETEFSPGGGKTEYPQIVALLSDFIEGGSTTFIVRT
jgi:hypothetical protein